MLDAVYTYKHTPSDELEWSIKSLKNIPHRNIYVIGDDPKIEGVIYIKPDRQYWGRYSKYHNQIQNYLMASNIEDISDDFIAMNDDFFILKPWEPVNYNRGNLESHANNRKRSDIYTNSLQRTFMYLETRNLLTLSFELHIPFVFNKERLKQLVENLRPDIRNTYQIRSLYGNIYKLNTEYHEDVKNVLTEDSVLTSTSNQTWRTELGKQIKERIL